MAATEFRRHLPKGALTYLQAMPPWWRDVLAQRFTVDGAEQPLLIAVRDGYLNVYAEGQSVLKIGFDARRSSDVRLHCEIHRKYVLGPEAGDGYLLFDGERVTAHAGTEVVASYDGPTTLQRWVEAARGYAGDEKRGVAAIVANHPEVIDVEMALPADEPAVAGGTKVASRMDIVALERCADRTRLAFYEAKLFSNPELRADDLKPRVLGQLGRYRDYASAPERRGQIVKAYREACKLFVKIAGMRGVVAAPLVQDVAGGADLDLDPMPRLVVYGYEPKQTATGTSWHRHADALRQHGVDLILAASARDVRLRAA